MTPGNDDLRSNKSKTLHDDAVVPERHLTTNHGAPISDNHNTLTAGVRGPQLLEDHSFREKMTHFDHERIPSGWCIPGGPVPMVFSRSTSPCPTSPPPRS